MTKHHFSQTALLFCFSFNLISCSSSDPSAINDHQRETNHVLVDSLATPETVALYHTLARVSTDGVLFGHQDDLAYGIGWTDEPGRSDVHDVCGDYPAVYGWDLGDIHQPSNLDDVSFARMKEWIKEAHARGGIITISMHLDNPVTDGDVWDNTPAVSSILPGRSHHASYIETLDRIALFLTDLITPDGSPIPIIFRPYHEHNHTWSWWGQSSCTVEEYNALWRMTVEHLRDTHGLHNLLYAISPQDIQTEAEYLERYPGDDYVDIFGLDYYRLTSPSNVVELGQALDIVASLAEQRGKISALTEVGVEAVPVTTWWTEYLLAAIRYSEASKKTTWALVWRNFSTDHHFAPYPGHPSVPDFLDFYNDPFTLFEQDISAQN